MIFCYIFISVLLVFQLCLIIWLRKKLKQQKSINKQIDKNQVTLSNNIMSLNTCIQKTMNNAEKQYDSIKRIEMIIVQKLNPLLEKNQIVDELRRKLGDSERTVNELRSTVLQMSQTFKRMKREEKEEKGQETVKRRKSKKS